MVSVTKLNQETKTLHVKNGFSLTEKEGLTSAWYFVSGCTWFDSWEDAQKAVRMIKWYDF